jgi:hypothetical protein
VVVEGATGQHLRSNVSWLFIAEHSEFQTAGAVEKSEQLKLEQQHDQVDCGQQGVIRPGSPEAWSQGSGPPGGERERESIRRSILNFAQDTG